MAAPGVLNQGEELELGRIKQVEVAADFLATLSTLTTGTGVFTVEGVLNARPEARATLYPNLYRRAFVCAQEICAKLRGEVFESLRCGADLGGSERPQEQASSPCVAL